MNSKLSKSKSMPKEETLYTFTADNYRLQLVCIKKIPQFVYQVRKNRKRIAKSVNLSDMKNCFVRELHAKTMQLDLFV